MVRVPNFNIDNRTVSLRVPAGHAEARHIEHRPAGADANPYLVLAAVLAGIHHGITRKLDPGPPVTGNGYEQQANRLPTDWNAAIACFRRSAVLREYFGNEFVDCFPTSGSTQIGLNLVFMEDISKVHTPGEIWPEGPSHFNIY